eukprot:jgi/Chlat1/6981/Chrsp55S06653
MVSQGHFRYKYTWVSKLPFPVSTPASPLEVFVDPPTGWQPHMPWPPRALKRPKPWWLRKLDALIWDGTDECEEPFAKNQRQGLP